MIELNKIKISWNTGSRFFEKDGEDVSGGGDELRQTLRVRSIGKLPRLQGCVSSSLRRYLLKENDFQLSTRQFILFFYDVDSFWWSRC